MFKNLFTGLYYENHANGIYEGLKNSERVLCDRLSYLGKQNKPKLYSETKKLLKNCRERLKDYQM